MPGAEDSTSTVGSSFHDRSAVQDSSANAEGGDAWLGAGNKSLLTSGGGGSSAAGGGLGAGAAGLGGGLLTSGTSGRSLGDAAAALGEDSDDNIAVGPGSSTAGAADSSSTSGEVQSGGGLSFRTDEDGSMIGGTSFHSNANATAEAEAEAEAGGAGVGVGVGSMGGPAVAAAAAAGLPPTGRISSRDGSRHAVGPRSSGHSALPSGQRSRAGSSASSGLEEFRQMTDEERQQVMEESDAARAASLLRGSSFKVPLQPDLERAITEQEQERRRLAVQAVESSRAPIATDAPEGEGAAAAAEGAPAGGGGGAAASVLDPSPAGMSPPSTATSIMGKMVAGLGMGRFFGGDAGSRSPSSMAAAAASRTAAAEAAAEGEPTIEEDFKAGPAEDAAAAAVPQAAAAGEGGAGGVGSAVEAETASAPGVGVAGAAAAGVTTVAGIAAIGAAAAGDRSSQKTDEKARAEAEASATTTASVAAAAAAIKEEEALREGSLSPEEVQAYSDKVDRTLEVCSVLLYILYGYSHPVSVTRAPPERV